MTAARERGSRGTREVLELAVLCAVAGVAHLVLAGASTVDTGSGVLFAIAALLAAAAAVRHLARPRPGAAEEAGAGASGGDRRLWRLRASVTDRPGRLADLASGLAGLGGDIRTVHVHPVADGAVDEVLVHVPARVGERELRRAVVAAGGREVTACPADVRELDDVPTRTLHLAVELVSGRGELVRALRGILGAVEVRWQEHPPPGTDADGLAGAALSLAAPDGGVLVLERPGAAFTPAECARAAAVVELASACLARPRPEVTEIDTVHGALTVRVADREDVDLVAEFHARCSTAARYRRYFGPGPTAGDGLRRLLTPALGRTLLVQRAGGEVVAMGNLMRDGWEAELALLVRDDWQRRGIGSRLAAELVGQAEADGVRAVRAHTHVDNTAIARTLRAAGLKLVGVPEPGEWSWSRTFAAAR